MRDLEKALRDYEDCFDENYPLVVSMQMADDEIIAEIERCIKTKKKAKPPLLYDNLDY